MPSKLSFVPCPRCGKNVTWNAANPFRPFCSERCKLIDLGQWASERYRIPAKDNSSSGTGHKDNS
ncbi:MAG: DNA gyrase inhibitor YacG [Burkholderiales bacterium]